jgi:hypothetical protein
MDTQHSGTNVLFNCQIRLVSAITTLLLNAPELGNSQLKVNKICIGIVSAI